MAVILIEILTAWVMANNNSRNSIKVHHKTSSSPRRLGITTVEMAVTTLMVLDLAVITTINMVDIMQAALAIKVDESKDRLLLKNATCRCSKTRQEIRQTTPVQLSFTSSRHKMQTTMVTQMQQLSKWRITKITTQATINNKQAMVQSSSSTMAPWDINNHTMPLINNMQPTLLKVNKTITSNISSTTVSITDNNTNSNPSSNLRANTKADNKQLLMTRKRMKIKEKVIKIEEG